MYHGMVMLILWVLFPELSKYNRGGDSSLRSTCKRADGNAAWFLGFLHYPVGAEFLEDLGDENYDPCDICLGTSVVNNDFEYHLLGE